jgi:hypothetical protein
MFSLVARQFLAVGSSVVKRSRVLLPLASVDTTIKNNPFSDVAKQRSSKVKKKAKSSTEEPSGRSRDLEILLACLDAPKSKLPPADDEELARREEIMKAYTIGKFKQHNLESHDLACKLRMKRHAINMLPKKSKLKEKALEIDDSSPPPWRRIPAWTPPIPGFDPTPFMTTEE